MNKVISGEPDDLILGGVNWIKDNWPVVCKEAKIEGLHFHDLRATYMTRILEAGFDSFTARDAVGYSTVKTTGIYARPSIARVRKALDSLSGTAQIQSARFNQEEMPGQVAKKNLESFVPFLSHLALSAILGQSYKS